MREEEVLQKIEKAARDRATVLDLRGSQLITLPHEIGELTNLIGLGLWGNRLTTLLPKITELTRLTTLDLRGNPLPIPPEILEKTGEPATIINFPEGHSEEVNVKELLNGIESEEERRERREEGDLKKRDSAPRSPPPPHPVTPDKPPNTWISGLFYLVAAAVMVIVLAVISKYVPVYALPVVIIGGILFIVLIGLFQLILAGKLTQDNFVTLMRDIFKHLHLLKR